MNKIVYVLVIGFALFILWAALIRPFRPAAERIDEIGVKGVIERIWNGRQ